MISWLMYLTADALARTLPRGAADRLGAWIARRLFALRVPARAHLERNLARLLGPGREAEVEATARAAFENFALSLADFLRLAHGDDRELAARVMTLQMVILVPLTIEDDTLARGLDIYLNVNNHYEGSAPLSIAKIRAAIERRSQSPATEP